MNFDFFSAPRIAFGVGKLSLIGDIVKPLGQRALLVHSGSAQSAVEAAQTALSDAGVAYVLHRQQGEPEVSHVDAAAELARDDNTSVVIGIGGGSAIDAAKAVAALIANGGSALNYMEVVGEGRKISQRSLPWVAVPTTAGAGAEVTRNAVVSFPPRQFKASIRSDLMMAQTVIVDPQLSVSCSKNVTAASGMDALCQCIEAYTSNNANKLSDAAALTGLMNGSSMLQRCVDSPDDLEARSAMSLCALCSGLALTSAGLGAVHGFAAPMGANFPIPHGVVCAALLHGVMHANVIEAGRLQNQPLLDRYAVIGRLLANDGGLARDAAINAGIARAEELTRILGIPRLSEFGVGRDRLDEMITLASKSSSMKYNPVELDADMLKRVLVDAL